MLTETPENEPLTACQAQALLNSFNQGKDERPHFLTVHLKGGEFLFIVTKDTQGKRDITLKNERQKRDLMKHVDKGAHSDILEVLAVPITNLEDGEYESISGNSYLFIEESKEQSCHYDVTVKDPKSSGKFYSKTLAEVRKLSCK